MNSYDQMLKALAKTKLVKKGLAHNNNDNHISTRLNTGGVKLSENRHIRMAQLELNLLLTSERYICAKTCITVICRDESSQAAQCHFFTVVTRNIQQLAEFTRRKNIAKETDHFFTRMANQRITTLIFDHSQGGKSIPPETDGIDSQTVESQ
jgi:hypothetical protein